jgi:hypothetical protein
MKCQDQLDELGYFQKNKKGEVLIAILKDKLDFAILQEQGWYRITVKHAPRRWPQRWLVFI